MADPAEMFDQERTLSPSVGPQVPPLILGIGTVGDDLMEGTPLPDRLDVLAGNDTVIGRGGDDSIFGRAGDDVLNGGAGNDRLEGGRGDDRVGGGRGADIVNGGAGADLVLGGGGGDQLGGQGGDDRLAGGKGDDLLAGGRGDDLLDGGPGADTLIGGAGRDIFGFSSIDGEIDTVADYRQGVDQLDLSLVLPDFAAGDPLADFVRLTVDGDDTLIAVNQDGLGSDFVDLARLEGVQIDALPPAELGLPSGPTPLSANVDGEVADGAPVELAVQAVLSAADVLSDAASSNAGGGGTAPPVGAPAPDLGSLVDLPNQSAV